MIPLGSVPRKRFGPMLRTYHPGRSLQIEVSKNVSEKICSYDFLMLSSGGTTVRYSCSLVVDKSPTGSRP